MFLASRASRAGAISMTGTVWPPCPYFQLCINDVIVKQARFHIHLHIQPLFSSLMEGTLVVSK